MIVTASAQIRAFASHLVAVAICADEEQLTVAFYDDDSTPAAADTPLLKYIVPAGTSITANLGSYRRTGENFPKGIYCKVTGAVGDGAICITLG